MADRTHRFFTGLVAGYAEVAANFFFTLASVPFALHFLPKEEFGLWVLILQISSYFSLLDLGMSSSVARFIATHKDRMEDGEYGNVLRTGHRFFLCQSTLVVLLSFFAIWILPSWLAVPSHLLLPFRILIFGQGLTTAIGLSVRMWGSPLSAHQRQDIVHWTGVANLLTALLVLCLSFWLGAGIYSLLLASFSGSLCSWFLPWLACCRLGFYPSASASGAFQWPLFLKMMRFGGDVFTIQLGNLICSGAPIILITRTLGLEAAATYSIGIKFLTMGQLIIGRLFNNSAPGLTEICVRGDHSRFVSRFHQIISLSATLAVPTAFALMSANRSFIAAWTSGSIHWPIQCDLLLGPILVASLISRCFIGAFGIIGNYRPVRYLSLCEGLLFLLVGIPLTLSWGLFGALLSSLFSHFCASLIPSWRILRAQLPSSDSRLLNLMLLLLPLAVVQSLFLASFFSSPKAILLSTVLSTPLWLFISWHTCLTSAERFEYLNHISCFYVFEKLRTIKASIWS